MDMELGPAAPVATVTGMVVATTDLSMLRGSRVVAHVGVAGGCSMAAS